MKWVMVATVVICTALADLLQSFEMKRHVVAVEDLRPGRLGSMLARLAHRAPLVLAVFFMAISFFAFLKLLSLADLSFAVPVTAASVVIETVLAKLVLKETVTFKRWTGACLVACGVALLAM
jgi:drug/metabolite transporter (DMT)-like permease